MNHETSHARGAVLLALCVVLGVASQPRASMLRSAVAAQSAQTSEHPALTGAWTLNKDLSDEPVTRDGRDETDRGDGTRRGGGMGRGGFGRGGGGFGRGGSGGGVGGANPEDTARVRDAMRDIMNPPDHLVITQTDSTIVMTGPDGRTTRLSADGKKIKDENTKVERKTKWDGGKLVSEITGLGPRKLTQTFAVDEEHHQLRIAVQADAGRSGQPRTTTHVYDQDAR
ncbi:MAG TPA: hypothetical protein VNZ26_31880 [Vicinamibacterales bacterium]|jgi:hypothetical protein|nr:hypothetical protein [Vicinamibacterales bacterium]